MTQNFRHLQQKLHHLPTRREFLWQSGGGLGSLALAAMLGHDEALAQGGKLHHPAKAKRVIHFFMAGAASHLDLFDYKPELAKRHGQILHGSS